MTHPPAGVPVDTPPPAEPPAYPPAPGKVSRSGPWRIEDVVDTGFSLIGAALAVWLGVVLVVGHLQMSIGLLAYLIVFWLLVAYVGLPRLQEVLAHIYVPDYFIGRTVTGIGVLGDPVNLALDGTEAAVHAAMREAGWTRADEVTLRSSWGIVVSTVLRRSYPAAPVSPLLALGHRQAFAYEKEVDGNAAQRHHVRFWPTPDGWLLPGGFAVDWIAAATYDRAVGLSLFTLQVTHKIDADIDVERDFVVATVRYRVAAARLRVVDGFSTAFHARNGGGDVVRTDGDLPILDLTAVDAPEPVPPAPSAPPRRRPSTWRLPPPVLLASAVMILAKAALTLTGAGVVLTGASRRELLPSVGDAQLTLTGLGAVASVALLGLVLARRRWARTLLMAECTVETIAQLVSLGTANRISPLVLATAGVSVLVLIAVSSTTARRWVTSRRVVDPSPGFATV